MKLAECFEEGRKAARSDKELGAAVRACTPAFLTEKEKQWWVRGYDTEVNLQGDTAVEDKKLIGKLLYRSLECGDCSYLYVVERSKYPESWDAYEIQSDCAYYQGVNYDCIHEDRVAKHRLATADEKERLIRMLERSPEVSLLKLLTQEDANS